MVRVIAPTDTVLKRTRSRCPVCFSACPAKVLRRQSGDGAATVHLSRRCALHGLHETCIASDARFYWLAKGGTSCCEPGSACCAATGEPTGTLGRNAGVRADEPFEKLSTCLALIEIVDSCNLSCPTCYADSPLRSSGIEARPIAELQSRIQGVIDRKGVIDILQFSGGEPTLHPRFFELLEWAQTNQGIRYVLINTNGVRIARDDEFLSRLAEAARLRSLQVYLQFDGTGEEGQRELRGADLRAVRELAIRRCGEIGLPVTLAMTVTPANLGNVWETVEFGLRFPNIRGVSFQPFFTSGRRSAIDPVNHQPLNTADVIVNLVEDSGGVLGFDDFTPLPCGDPNCATIGYLLRVNGAIHSVSEFVDFRELQEFLRDKVRYSLDDLTKCGCENEPLGDLLREFELDESHAFRLFVKPFMDAFSWDEDRIDRCCTHVIRPDGKLDSFCRYYSGFPDMVSAP